MNETEKFRQDEAKRITKWAMSNPVEWSGMFFRGVFEILPENVLHYIDVLEEQGFYYLIPAILTMSSTNLIIDNALTALSYNISPEAWENKDIKDINNEIKDMIRKLLKERQEAESH